ncbi:MAG: nucleotidyltransferase domain-containing protein [Candidatus Bipolaricaulota bacterium]
MGTSSVGPALFGKTRLAVLTLLYGHAQRRFYLTEILRRTGAGRGAVQRELARLTHAGLLTRTPDGQQVYFQANEMAPAFEELRGLIRKTSGVVDVLRAALEPLADRIDAAAVYGSMARGDETAASDVDLLVIGDVSLFDIVSATAHVRDALGRELNPTVFATNEFRERRRTGEHFVASVLRSPKLQLIGDLDELD